jgi:hypothetical protein
MSSYRRKAKEQTRKRRKRIEATIDTKERRTIGSKVERLRTFDNL